MKEFEGVSDALKLLAKPAIIGSDALPARFATSRESCAAPDPAAAELLAGKGWLALAPDELDDDGELPETDDVEFIDGFPRMISMPG